MTYTAGMQVGDLVRQTRERHALSQTQLARRARTSQRQISRIERSEISPSVTTVTRLLAAMGERLDLRAVPAPSGNQTGDELRSDHRDLSAIERVAQAAALSHSLTSIAAMRQR